MGTAASLHWTATLADAFRIYNIRTRPQGGTAWATAGSVTGGAYLLDTSLLSGALAVRVEGGRYRVIAARICGLPLLDGGVTMLPMSTISAIFEPSTDGTLHLPVPAAWRNRAIRVRAEMEPVAVGEPPAEQPGLKGFGCLRGKVTMAGDFEEPLEDFKDYF